jgi:hypothetical protein
VRVPALADHLYLVLVHAALHGFAGNPLWLTDAALLAQSADRDTWDEVRGLAERGAGRIALQAALDQLALCGFGAGLPDQVAVAPLRRWVMRRASGWLLRGEGDLGTWPSRVVRPLLFEHPVPFLRWSLAKLRIAAHELTARHESGPDQPP